MGPLKYTFTEWLLTGDAKATFYQAALEIGIHPVNNFNKVLLEMTTHSFSVYAYHEQKRYCHRQM